MMSWILLRFLNQNLSNVLCFRVRSYQHWSGRVDGVDISGSLPGAANLPSDEELEKRFIKHLNDILTDNNIALSQQ